MSRMLQPASNIWWPPEWGAAISSTEWSRPRDFPNKFPGPAIHCYPWNISGTRRNQNVCVSEETKLAHEILAAKKQPPPCVCRFDVDRADVNYLAVSANVAMEGSNGDPQKYEIFMKYEGLPSVSDHDLKSSLTASDSYVGNVLFRYQAVFPLAFPLDLLNSKLLFNSQLF